MLNPVEIVEDLLNFTHKSFAQKGKFPKAGVLRGNSKLGAKYAATQLGWEEGIKPALKLGLPFAAYALAKSSKGNFVSTAASQTGQIAGGYFGGAVGSLLGGVPGILVGNLIGATVGDEAGQLINPIMDVGKRINHSNFGGNYRDSEQAYTYRQKASQSMNSSLLNCRQFLGKEALLLHT
jgi:hypothetical protein